MFARRRAQTSLRRQQIALIGVMMTALTTAAVAAIVASEAYVGNGWELPVLPVIRSSLLGGFVGVLFVGGVLARAAQSMVKREIMQMAKEEFLGGTPPSEGPTWFASKSVGDAYRLAAAVGVLLGAISHSSSVIARIVATIVYAGLAAFVFWFAARFAARMKCRAMRFGDGSATRPE
jgi:hypothetical protein